MTSYRLSARARRDAIEQAIARGLTPRQVRVALNVSREDVLAAYTRIARAHIHTDSEIEHRRSA